MKGEYNQLRDAYRQIGKLRSTEYAMKRTDSSFAKQQPVTRRRLLASGSLAAVAALSRPRMSQAAEREPELAKTIAELEPYFTPQDKFRDVSRGKPLPHSLSEDKKREVGLKRETWKLEVVSDSENPATLGRELTKEDDTALDFAGLLKLAEKHAVRFAKVMTCLNIGCPLGMGIWEGVPLREVLWLTQPRERRAAGVLLRLSQRRSEADISKLAASRPRAGRSVRSSAGHFVLQAQWSVARQPTWRAGAHRRARSVRLQIDQVADARGAHAILPHANDTYANGNNDVDSPLKIVRRDAVGA